MINSKQLLELLTDTEMLVANEARRAIESGAPFVIAPIVHLAHYDELRSGYEFRAENVRRIESQHAQQLAKSIDEFTEMLDNAPPDSIQRINITPRDSDHEFIVWTDPKNEYNIIGIFKIISRLNVSSQRWADLMDRKANSIDKSGDSCSS